MTFQQKMPIGLQQNGISPDSHGGYQSFPPPQGQQIAFPSFPPQPSPPSYQSTILPGTNILSAENFQQTDITSSLLNIDKLKVSPPQRQQDESFFARPFNGQDIYFSNSLDANKLFFVKNLSDDSMSCQGRINADVSNNGQPLTESFPSKIRYDYTEGEVNWLLTRRINKVDPPSVQQENIETV